MVGSKEAVGVANLDTLGSGERCLLTGANERYSLTPTLDTDCQNTLILKYSQKYAFINYSPDNGWSVIPSYRSWPPSDLGLSVAVGNVNGMKLEADHYRLSKRQTISYTVSYENGGNDC